MVKKANIQAVTTKSQLTKAIKKKPKEPSVLGKEVVEQAKPKSAFFPYSHISKCFDKKPSDEVSIDEASPLYRAAQIIGSSKKSETNKISALEELLTSFLCQEPKITLNDEEIENKNKLFALLRKRGEEDVATAVNAIASLIFDINQNNNQEQLERKGMLKAVLFRDLKNICSPGLANLAKDLIIKAGYIEPLLESIIINTMTNTELCTIAESHQTHLKTFIKENFFGFKENEDSYAEPSHFITANLLKKQFYEDVLEESLTAKNFTFKLYEQVVNKALSDKGIASTINKIVNDNFEPEEHKAKIDYIHSSIEEKLQGRFDECGLDYSNVFKYKNSLLCLVFMPKSLREKFSEIYKEYLEYDSEGNLEEGCEYMQPISDVIRGLSKEDIFAKNYKYNIKPAELDLLTNSLISKLFKDTDKNQHEDNSQTIIEKNKILKEAVKNINNTPVKGENLSTLNRFYDLAKTGDRRISDALIGMASCNEIIAKNFYEALSKWPKEDLLEILEYYIKDNKSNRLQHKDVLKSLTEVFVFGKSYSDRGKIKDTLKAKKSKETYDKEGLLSLKNNIEDSTQDSIDYLRNNYILKKFLKTFHGTYLSNIINLLYETTCGKEFILNSFYSDAKDSIVFKALEEEEDNEQKRFVLSNLTKATRLILQKPKLALMKKLKAVDSNGKTIFHHYENNGILGPFSAGDAKDVLRECGDALAVRDKSGKIAFYNIWTLLYYRKLHDPQSASGDYCGKILEITDGNKNNILHTIMSGKNEIMHDYKPKEDDLGYLKTFTTQAILELLKQKNNDGFTPIDLALNNSNFDYVDKIREILAITNPSNQKNGTSGAVEISKHCLPWFLNQISLQLDNKKSSSTTEENESLNKNVDKLINIIDDLRTSKQHDTFLQETLCNLQEPQRLKLLKVMENYLKFSSDDDKEDKEDKISNFLLLLNGLPNCKALSSFSSDSVGSFLSFLNRNDHLNVVKTIFSEILDHESGYNFAKQALNQHNSHGNNAGYDYDSANKRDDYKPNLDELMDSILTKPNPATTTDEHEYCDFLQAGIQSNEEQIQRLGSPVYRNNENNVIKTNYRAVTLSTRMSKYYRGIVKNTHDEEGTLKRQKTDLGAFVTDPQLNEFNSRQKYL